MAFHCLVIALISFIAAAISVSSSPTMAKPNCLDRCGNISIPFPFGTTEDCYRRRSFWVTCNQTSHPPKLFWWNTTLELTDLSLDGQAKLMNSIARDCYGRVGDGTLNKISTDAMIRLASLFTVNTTANKLTMVGCNAEASVSGGRIRPQNNLETGCKAMCEDQSDLLEGSCAGLGCCQLSIPTHVWIVNVTSLNSNWSNRNFSDCNFAFVAEESPFRFSPQNLTNLRNVNRLPMVVDWVIGSEECVDAMKNSTSYACKSVNSTCYHPDSDNGYRCRCFDGYGGNPYLDGGCQDIDECQDGSLNTCTHGCKNTIGSYECHCPKGYRGDGRKGGEGCSRDESFILRLIAGVALGIIVLLLSSILLHLELMRRFSEKTKQKLFLRNGGMLLQEKLMRGERSADAVRIFTSSDTIQDENENELHGHGEEGLHGEDVVPLRRSSRRTKLSSRLIGYELD